MKIQKVIIEGLHNITRKEYTFEDTNYLYGKNGAGKSSVLQAIQLGLLGYIPGSNKTKQGTFAHSNNHTMAVKLILDNGVSIQRVWTKSKTSVSESVTVVPEGYDINTLVKDVELPLFNFDEFSHMTSNSLKDWFINYLPKHSFSTDWNSVLKDSVSSLPEECVDTNLIRESVEAIEEFNSTGVDEIRQANTYFKNELSFCKKELERKTSTIQSLIHYDDYVESYSEFELKSMIDSKEASIRSAYISKQKSERVKSMKREISELEPSLDLLNNYKQKVDDLSPEMSKISSELESKTAELANINSEYKSYDDIINSQGTCVFTGDKCDKIQNLISSYLSRRSELSKKRISIQSDILDLRQQLAEITEKLKQLNIRMDSCRNNETRIQFLNRELEFLGEFETVSDESISDMENSLRNLKEMLVKSAANKQYNELNEMIIKDKYRLENTIECLKAWIKLTDVNGLQASGDYNPFDVLASDINPVISSVFNNPDAKCKFYSDGKSNSFTFGLERVHEGYVPYNMLSSGEKCMFLISMFIGLLNYTKSSMKLILIDDLLDHLDEENFESVLNSIQSAYDIQFIFAGVKPISMESVNTIEI